MSFLPGRKKEKEKEKPSAATSPQFYVEFLGWMPSRGIRGTAYTLPVAGELLKRMKKNPNVPKMTLQVSERDIKISLENVEDQKKRKIQTIKYPSILTRDITYVTTLSRPNSDVVTCIYLGYNPQTRSMAHVHVYRFDSPNTAGTFVGLLSRIIETKDHQALVSNVEEKMCQDGYIECPAPQIAHLPDRVSASPPGSSSSEEVPSAEDCEVDMASLREIMPFDCVTEELKQRLKLKDTPILLPPKDYDTVRRKQGDIGNAEKRKCLNENIVGHGSRNPDMAEPAEKTEASEKTPPTSPVFHYPARIPSVSEDSDRPRSPPDSPRLQFRERKVYHGGDNSQSTVRSNLSGSSSHSGGESGTIPTKAADLEIPPDYDDVNSQQQQQLRLKPGRMRGDMVNSMPPLSKQNNNARHLSDSSGYRSFQNMRANDASAKQEHPRERWHSFQARSHFSDE